MMRYTRHHSKIVNQGHPVILNEVKDLALREPFARLDSSRSLRMTTMGGSGPASSLVGIAALLIAALLPAVAYAGELDVLVRDLAGPDEHARVVARQLLPRHGVEALAPLLPLLAHENPSIHAAAYNVVEDVANQACAPGREADRLVATRALMDLVKKKHPKPVRVKGLRLLPLVIPEGYDVGPIAALLDDKDPDLREKARAALQHTGSHDAAKALLKAVRGTDPAFACALLDAVGHIEDPASVKPLRRIARKHKAQAVRTAAVRALAWTGDPGLRGVFRDVRDEVPPELAFDATQATILYAESMAKHGGNWDRAVGLFRDVLETTDDPMLKAAAVVGLGRFGDETVVDAIFAATQDADEAVQEAAVAALEALRGRAASLRMAEVYDTLDASMRARLVAVFGCRHDPALLPILQAEAMSEDPLLRMAALRALGESGLADALPVLVEVAQNGSDEERALALAGASKVANAAGAANDTAAAGRAFLALYGLAQTDADRVAALRGLARYPVADALDTVLAALEQEPLREAAWQVVPELLRPLAAAGDDANALRVFELATKADPSPDRVVRMASKLQGIASGLDTAKLLGVIKTWHIIGPFPWQQDSDWDKPFVGEPDIDLAATYRVGDADLAWQPHTSGDATGTLNLMSIYGQIDRQFAYAYTEVDVAEAQPGQIRVGSDDGNAVWLNGERIWLNPCDRGMALDQDLVDCQFQQGVNRILLKISQGGGGWGFCARLTKPDGTALAFEVATGK